MGCCAIFVPFFEYYFLKRLPSRWQCIGLLVAMSGVGFLAIHPGFDLDIGTIYGLISAVLFAAWSVSLSYSVRFVNPIALGLGQIFGAALVALLISLLLGEFVFPRTYTSWLAILYLGAVSVAFRFITQTWAQQFTTATSTEIVFLLEPCGAMIWGYLFASEIPTLRQSAACAIIISGILLSHLPTRAAQNLNSL